MSHFFKVILVLKFRLVARAISAVMRAPDGAQLEDSWNPLYDTDRGFSPVSSKLVRGRLEPGTGG